MKYKSVGLGGTFDHFHSGHQAFLLSIAEQADYLNIGITKPELIGNKAFSEVLEPYIVREQAVRDFCKKNEIICNIFPLNDIYGPTLTDTRIEAVFVTEETEKGGQLINSKRLELGLEPLSIVKVNMISASSGQIISSQRIRKGEMSRTGVVYKHLFTQDILLTETSRAFFSKLHGKIVSVPHNDHKSMYRCVVGDTSFETFLNNNWTYSIGVVDFKKRRQEYQPSSEILTTIDRTVSNPAGGITTELVTVLGQSIEHCLENPVAKTVIKVNGEEDLAAVVAVLLLPLGSSVYYGQPNMGMVEVIVTEDLKKKFYNVLTVTA